MIAEMVRSTHAVEMADGLVVKRFCSWERGEHQREWQALKLLAEFAPGLAPAPVTADLDADPPAITMTRLPGEPLAGQPVTARHLDRSSPRRQVDIYDDQPKRPQLMTT
jgi:hypothetical protein